MHILLRSRTSFFSSGPLCTRQDCVSANHWLDRYNSGTLGTTSSSWPDTKLQRKKSIIPKSYRSHLENGGVQTLGLLKGRRPRVQKENRRPLSRKEKPRMRGTFYGNAQPPSFLQPIPLLPSYSDQSDCESLIDDADADLEDTGWVGELMETLGPYSTRDFSQIDTQRDRRMETSFHRIMEEEGRTAKIGIEIDRREAEKN